MYTAVRMVKMNACRKLTRISKPVRRDEQRERERQDDDRDASPPTAPRSSDAERHQDEVAGEHVGEESDRQRERPDDERSETNSIGATSGRIAFGTPGGTVEFLR